MGLWRLQFVAVLQDASPHWDQGGAAEGSCQAHPGGGGAAQRHRVALVCWAALDGVAVADAQQGGVGGHVATAGVVQAALKVEAHEVGQGRETWAGIMELDLNCISCFLYAVAWKYNTKKVNDENQGLGVQRVFQGVSMTVTWDFTHWLFR